MIWLLIICSSCVGLASFGAAVVFAMCFWKRQTSSEAKSDSRNLPSAAVVLCVRGNDPFLTETVTALTRQDYDNYRILVVVDHHEDPAWGTLKQLKRDLDNDAVKHQLEIQELKQHANNRGLKCSALLQAVQSIEEDVIVTIDSDAVPHPNWLTELISPLQNEAVGATSGNQWFEPSSTGLGSWVRSVWHAGAIVPTAVLGNSWAGAFAMRRQDMLQGGLIADWENSIIDDGPVRKSLQTLQKSLVFVPATISINREDCSLAFCFRYVARMLTWSRLFEATFWITLVHMIGYVGVNIAAAVIAITSLLLPNAGIPASLAIPNLLVLIALQLGGYFLIRATVFSNQTSTDELSPKVSWIVRLLMPAIAFPFTLLAYAYGATKSVVTREILWRQTRYTVRRGCDVQMHNYHPYKSDDQHANRSI